MDWKLSRAASILRLLADGTPRRCVDMARALNLTRHHISNIVRELHRDGLIRVADWDRNAAMYLPANGEPDVEQPPAKEAHSKIARRIRQAEAEAGIEPGSDPELAMQIEVGIKREGAAVAIGQMLAARQHPDPLMRAMYATA